MAWSGSLPGTAYDYKLRVVSRYTRLDSFVVKHIALFWTTNLEAVSVLLLLLLCIYPLTPRPHLLHIQLPRFPLPRFPPLLSGATFSTPAFSAPPPVVDSQSII